MGYGPKGRQSNSATATDFLPAQLPASASASHLSQSSPAVYQRTSPNDETRGGFESSEFHYPLTICSRRRPPPTGKGGAGLTAFRSGEADSPGPARSLEATGGPATAGSGSGSRCRPRLRSRSRVP